MSKIVFGPSGCGKSRNAEKIRQHFDLSIVLDDYKNGQPLPSYALALTNEPIVGALDYYDVMYDIVELEANNA